jgi:hypothetical protein
VTPSPNPPHRPAWQTALGAVVWVLACGVATLALWFAFDLVYVSTGNETDHASPADVIIVLGCPSYEGNVVSATCTQMRRVDASQATLVVFLA